MEATNEEVVKSVFGSCPRVKVPCPESAWNLPGHCLVGDHDCTPGLEHPGIIISLVQAIEIERLGALQQLPDINHEHHR